MSSNRTSGISRKTPFKSQKLDRTLQELESAFLDWEALGTIKAPENSPSDSSQANSSGPLLSGASTSENDLEFAKKTKKLLIQLREQLSELND
jgi:hypothetical protein